MPRWSPEGRRGWRFVYSSLRAFKPATTAQLLPISVTSSSYVDKILSRILNRLRAGTPYHRAVGFNRGPAYQPASLCNLLSDQDTGAQQLAHPPGRQSKGAGCGFDCQCVGVKCHDHAPHITGIGTNCKTKKHDETLNACEPLRAGGRPRGLSRLVDCRRWNSSLTKRITLALSAAPTPDFSETGRGIRKALYRRPWALHIGPPGTYPEV